VAATDSSSILDSTDLYRYFKCKFADIFLWKWALVDTSVVQPLDDDDDNGEDEE
jgi:hypothetical protein